jgi:osmotically inducible protein OsmC
MATRDGIAEWQGDLKGGNGTVTVSSGLFEGQYSYTTRFEDGPGTNPEELIGAAQAGCYSMQLSAMLANDGNTPDSVETTAKVHLRMVEGAPRITKIDLVVEGRVPGIDQAAFEEAAQKAKEACLITKALAGVDEITLDAKLAS